MLLGLRLREQVIKTSTIPWPPYIQELENDENLNEILLKLITWLKRPNKSVAEENLSFRTIAYILTSYITGKHTKFETNLCTVLLHGMT